MTILTRRMRWGGHVARITEKTISYRIFVGEPEGGISQHKWDTREIGWMIQSGLIWLRIVTSGWLL
jgi:hypothetical protein